METTYQQHVNFLVEPMGNMSVTSLPGIGEVQGQNLEQQGFDKTCVVLGKFLLLKKDREMFTEWLMDASDASPHQASACEQCLRDWCDTFL
ncbi:barrier-to-autointegration factor-like [Sebastes fasciatus]|uniref:barrier-to-autointegration factor-like n=1 Tax=Sebastes fasciatus TaxID=394691 RepID=UPI003D9F25EA